MSRGMEVCPDMQDSSKPGPHRLSEYMLSSETSREVEMNYQSYRWLSSSLGFHSRFGKH